MRLYQIPRLLFLLVLANLPALAQTGWTFLQDITWSCSSKVGSATCATTDDTANYILPTTSGSVMIVWAATGNNVTVSSATGGGGTWVHPSATHNYQSGGGGNNIDAAYNITGTGSATSISVTLSGNSSGYWQAYFVELLPPSGYSASFDTSNATGSASCTSCATAALTLAATDAVVHTANTSNSPTAEFGWWPSPYVTAPFLQGLALNTTNGASVNLGQTPSGGSFVDSGLAFKSSEGTFTAPSQVFTEVQGYSPSAGGVTTCSPTCTLTVPATATIGNLVMLVAADVGASSQQYLSSVSGTGFGTFTVPSGANTCRIGITGAGARKISCAYTTVTSTGHTSVLVTMAGSTSYVAFAWYEISGASTLDTQASSQPAAGATFTGPTLTLSGSNDVIFQCSLAPGGISGVSLMPQGITDNSGFQESTVFVGSTGDYAAACGLLANTTNGTGPTWAYPAGSGLGPEGAFGIAFKSSSSSYTGTFADIVYSQNASSGLGAHFGSPSDRAISTQATVGLAAHSGSVSDRSFVLVSSSGLAAHFGSPAETISRISDASTGLSSHFGNVSDKLTGSNPASIGRFASPLEVSAFLVLTTPYQGKVAMANEYLILTLSPAGSGQHYGATSDAQTPFQFSAGLGVHSAGAQDYLTALDLGSLSTGRFGTASESIPLLDVRSLSAGRFQSAIDSGYLSDLASHQAGRSAFAQELSGILEAIIGHQGKGAMANELLSMTLLPTGLGQHYGAASDTFTSSNPASIGRFASPVEALAFVLASAANQGKGALASEVLSMLLSSSSLGQHYGAVSEASRLADSPAFLGSHFASTQEASAFLLVTIPHQGKGALANEFLVLALSSGSTASHFATPLDALSFSQIPGESAGHFASSLEVSTLSDLISFLRGKGIMVSELLALMETPGSSAQHYASSSEQVPADEKGLMLSDYLTTYEGWPGFGNPLSDSVLVSVGRVATAQESTQDVSIFNDFPQRLAGHQRSATDSIPNWSFAATLARHFSTAREASYLKENEITVIVRNGTQFNYVRGTVEALTLMESQGLIDIVWAPLVLPGHAATYIPPNLFGIYILPNTTLEVTK